MLYKLSLDKRVYWLLMAAGALSLGVGIYLMWSDIAVQDSLAGVLSGMGAGLLTVGVFCLVRRHRLSPERLRQEEIEAKDERNQMVRQKAFSAVSRATTFFIIALVVVLVALGYLVPALIVMSGLYFQLIVLLVALRYYQKRI